MADQGALSRRALVAEDDESLRAVLRFNLEEQGLACTVAARGDDAIAALRAAAKHDAPFDLVVTDIKMPGADGLQVLDAARGCSAATRVVIVTAYGTVEQAAEAVTLGAVDYITKPFRRAEFKARILRALQPTAPAPRRDERDEAPLIVGRSPQIEQLVDAIDRIASADVAVLLSGESGTGKELFARRLHTRSGRKGPFVAVNCAALPGNLLEAELFGHDKGAYTGADRARRGKFERARGGTLLLDEIGELPLPLQPKILRVLEESVVDRLGGGSIAVDARVVAATNRELPAEVAAGRFREDLYHRLSVVPLRVPPLRERPGDIECLARHFLASVSDEPIGMSEALLKALELLRWPGNVRELRNTIHRMVLLRRGPFLDLTDLVAHASPTAEVREATQVAPKGLLMPGELILPERPFVLKALEREIIERALARHEGNRSATARYLGMPRHALLYRLARYADADSAE